MKTQCHNVFHRLMSVKIYFLFLSHQSLLKKKAGCPTSFLIPKDMHGGVMSGNLLCKTTPYFFFFSLFTNI